MKRAFIALLGALAILAAVWWWTHRPTEENRIRRRLARLAELASKEGAESPTAMAIKVNGLGDLFESPFTVSLVDFPANGTYTASEISSHAARIRPMFEYLALSFHDLDVQIEENGTARARMTARLTARRKSGEDAAETREIVVELVKGSDDHWRFADFAEDRVFQR